MRFKNRNEAAELLFDRLKTYQGKHPLILGIPRGAMPIAGILHEKLGGDLDVILVHKLSAPSSPEFAIGSVSESGDVYLSPALSAMRELGGHLNERIEDEVKKLKLKRKLYSQASLEVSPRNRLVILVDDGVATGATLLSAIQAIRKFRPQKIICAVPVASPQAKKLIRDQVDEFVTLECPKEFFSVSEFYDEFPQVSDLEVVEILKKSHNTQLRSLKTGSRE